MSKIAKLTVIMPVHNGATTLVATLESLLRQLVKFDELIIIDDASTDDSKKIIKNYLTGKAEYKLIEHQKNLGLAATYNEGIKIAQGDLLVTLHQDVVLQEDALQKLVAPFSDGDVVAASHQVVHPMEIWNKYNFWEKCFFARQAGKTQAGIDGKFDCFRKTALKKVGLFDEKHFHSAGEDGDLVFRLKKIGKIADTKAEIIHLHKVDPNFSWREIIYKQAQYSEAQGVLLRLGRIRTVENILKSFFREMLVIGLFVPFVNVFSLILVFVYAFVYSKSVFSWEWRDYRIVMVPLLNSFLLGVSLIFSFRGFISKKQRA